MSFNEVLSGPVTVIRQSVFFYPRIHFSHDIFAKDIFLSQVTVCRLLAGVGGGCDVVEVGVHVLMSEEGRVSPCSP